MLAATHLGAARPAAQPRGRACWRCLSAICWRWPAGRAPSLSREALAARDLDADREALRGGGGHRRLPTLAPTTRRRSQDLDDAPAVLFAVGRGGRAEVFERLERLGAEPAVADRGHAQPEPLRQGGGVRAGPRPGRRGRAGGERPCARNRRDGPPRLPRGRRAAGRGAGVRAGRRIPAPPPRPAPGRCASAGWCWRSCRPGRSPFRWSFPARNRIMAGLARMTVVVEAADPSGSLITSRLRARPGSVRRGCARPRHLSTVARGTNGLLRDGAVPITGPRDVLDELFGAGARPLPPPDEPPALEPGRAPAARRPARRGAPRSSPRSPRTWAPRSGGRGRRSGAWSRRGTWCGAISAAGSAR